MKSTSFPKKIDLVYTIIDETDIINNNKKIDSIIYIYIYIYELNQNYPIVLLLLFISLFE